jgi:transcription initiation factor TFIIB
MIADDTLNADILRQYEDLYQQLWSSDLSKESYESENTAKETRGEGEGEGEGKGEGKGEGESEGESKNLKQFKESEIKGSGKGDGGCPECSSYETILDNGYVICVNCGLELDNSSTLSTQPEWKFDDDKTNDRCGMTNNMLLYESSLSTNIVACGYNSSKQRKLLNKLQLWQQMPSKERTLRDDFNQISNACGSHVQKCVVEYAQVLFKMGEDARKEEDEGHRSNTRVGLLAAAVFYAAKMHECAKSHKEIATWFGVDESYVTTGIKIFFRLMCNKIGMTNLITTHKSYVDKFCNNLGLSDEVRESAQEIANKAVTLGILVDNTPPTIAASSIFFVISMYGLNISKALVARRSNVSEVTISKTYQKMNCYLEYLL